MLAGFYPFQVFFQRLLDIQIHGLAPRHHKRGNLPVVQAKDVPHHFMLLVFDDPGARSFREHHIDFLLSYSLSAFLLMPRMRSINWVEPANSFTKGLETVASNNIGRATRRA